MAESPRIRRLRNDLRAMESLRADSTILDFTTPRNSGELSRVVLGPFFGPRVVARRRGAKSRFWTGMRCRFVLGALVPSLHA